MAFKRDPLFLIFFLLLSSGHARFNGAEDLKMQLAAENPHQFVFSNKKAAFWYGETQQPNRNAFQGYTILEQRYMQDYTLFTDGRILDRTTAAGIELYPDRLVRHYAHVTETFYFVDSLNMLLLEVVPARPLKLSAYFHFTEPITAGKWENGADGRSVHTRFPGFGLDKPGFISCRLAGKAGAVSPLTAGADQKIGSFSGGVGFKAQIEDTVFLGVFFAKTAPELKRMEALFSDPGKILKIRRRRIRQLLANSFANTGDSRLDNAWSRALLSLDDLVTEQRGKGIWAGLPWFNNYWGRDSFISFTGALLCTGQFQEARDVLLSFADFQERNPSSPYYGRIPNRVMLDEIIYNTADGTPWFIKACENYVKYSGDTAFIERIFPVVRRTVDGALQNYTDDLGFLTHRDAETWMDAVGTEGPWSPRGNRAVEIQALWLEQLRISAGWARQMGFQDLAGDWLKIYHKVRGNLPEYYWNSAGENLFDHLNPDGSPDEQVRPNQIFALTVPAEAVFTEEQAAGILRTMVNKLTYPWGVGSLWQGDPDFHPYHHYSPYYVPDAAYHNGIVWTWLSGPLLSALFPRNTALAYRLLTDEAAQILTKDAVGSYSELLEAWPRKGTPYPRISGTVSQAWNLAEFVRNVQQDLLGIHPDVPEKVLKLRPHLPTELTEIRFRFRYGAALLEGSYRREAGRFRCRLAAAGELADSVHIRLVLPADGDEIIEISRDWNPAQPLALTVETGKEAAGRAINRQYRKSKVRRLPDLKFCRPAMDFSLPVFRGPEYDLISPEDATRKPGGSAKLLFHADDPEGDDRGPSGRYVYPGHPAFTAGIFDGTSVKILKDDKYYYFDLGYRQLANPGWRPESGYQLTYTAIALNFGNNAGLRTQEVGMNANDTVPPEYAFNAIIYVGNGYRISDTRNAILAEYRPQDNTHPIGFVNEKTIRFSVPVKYFPENRLQSAYIMIGGQDDHGAGGVGEFRSVGLQRSDWQGGGGEAEGGNTSVYDVIKVR